MAARISAARDLPWRLAKASSFSISSSGMSARMRVIDILISYHDIVSIVILRCCLFLLHRVVEAIGPARLHKLLRADHAQLSVRDVAADRAPRGDDRVRADR